VKGLELSYIVTDVQWLDSVGNTTIIQSISYVQMSRCFLSYWAVAPQYQSCHVSIIRSCRWGGHGLSHLRCQLSALKQSLESEKGYSPLNWQVNSQEVLMDHCIICTMRIIVTISLKVQLSIPYQQIPSLFVCYRSSYTSIIRVLWSFSYRRKKETSRFHWGTIFVEHGSVYLDSESS